MTELRKMRPTRKVEFLFDERSLALLDESNMFGFGKPKDDAPTKCRCGWAGVHKQLVESRYISGPDTWAQMCGRDGWHYNCPRCGRLVDTYYFRVS